MENLQDTIKAYINNELTGTELADFEAQLATNTALQQEVQDTKDLVFVFQNEKLLALNAHLSHLRDTVTLDPTNDDDDFDVEGFIKEMEETPPNAVNIENTEGGAKPSSMPKSWWWGTGLVVLGILGVLFYQNQQKKTVLKALATQYLSSESNIPEASTNPRDDTPIDVAVGYYKAKEYAQAIPHFEKHIKQGRSVEDNYNVHLYLGYCYLMVQETEKASQSFSRVAHGDYSKVLINFSASGRYYYALTQLSVGKTDSVRLYLTHIKDDEKFGSDAILMLRALDKIGIK